MTYDGHAFPYYRTADEIRRQEFTHRLRGFDEEEVRAYLDLLADQTHADDNEMSRLRNELDRLRTENERLRAESRRQAPEPAPVPVPAAAATSTAGDDRAGAVSLLGQAQQVADQLVEEAVRHARDVISSAHREQREILRQAHEAADALLREAKAARQDGAANGYVASVAEIEGLRAFTRDAKAQLRSVLDSLVEQVDRLGEPPRAVTTVRADLPQQVEADAWPLRLLPETQPARQAPGGIE